MAVLELHQSNFEQEVLSEGTVLVDFWAPWCGPCRMTAPAVEEIAKEKEGKIKVCKVNIDEEPALAEKYQVMTIPTLMLVRNGNVVHIQSGAMGVEELRRMVEK